MWFLGIGLLLLAMKFMEIAPVAAWEWYVVLAPFLFAVLWWAWADNSGYTKRQAHKREEQRRKARLAKQRANIGLPAEAPPTKKRR